MRQRSKKAHKCYAVEELAAMDAEVDKILGARHPNDVTSVSMRVAMALHPDSPVTRGLLKGMQEMFKLAESSKDYESFEAAFKKLKVGPVDPSNADSASTPARLLPTPKKTRL